MVDINPAISINTSNVIGLNIPIKRQIVTVNKKQNKSKQKNKTQLYVVDKKLLKEYRYNYQGEKGALHNDKRVSYLKGHNNSYCAYT